jgi:hypothetical protein
MQEMMQLSRRMYKSSLAEPYLQLAAAYLNVSRGVLAPASDRGKTVGDNMTASTLSFMWSMESKQLQEGM